MTKITIRDYSLHMPAKSGIGIGVPDEKGDNRRASVFFVVVCTVTSQWWAVWGRSNPRRFLFPGYANPAQFTTKRLASQVVMIHKEKGSSYGHQNRS
ncbi:hypothetical protein CWI33_23600 [Escherichia coli]|nr:hypothetical protein CWI33_23600 [Escherichia coli]EFE7976739.1 hypothetical protein [Escherichia coli]